MTANPNQSPDDSTAPQLAAQNPNDLGELIAEYRVSRVVIWASRLLCVFTVGLCLLVISELFTSEYDSIWMPLSVLAVLLFVATASGFQAAAAVRSRLAVFERGIVHANMFRSREFRYAEIADMYVSDNPLFNLGINLIPMSPHLVISIGSPVQKTYYICPFLISKVELFKTAVNTWSAAKRGRQ